MSSARGIQRERQVRQLLTDDGWVVVRAAGSIGCADLVAIKRCEKTRLIEVKSTAAGPFAGFGPADRARLIEAAAIADADPWLVHWPPRKQPRWIPMEEWPDAAK